MAQFIETKVRCKEIQDSGKEKTVTNTYLIYALSFTEAEARATEEVAPYLKGDFKINAVKKSNIAEIVENENDPDEDGWEFTSLEQVHEFFKKQMALDKVVNYHTGEIVEIPKSTATMDTQQFSMYVDALRAYADEFLNVTIPEPDKNWRTAR